MDELVGLVEAAILDAATSFQSTGRGATIVGYALVVDGGFLSVYGACASGEVIKGKGDQTVLLNPSAWDREDHTAAFRRASESLEVTASALDDLAYDERVGVVVAALGDALERSRTACPALRDAFLSVVAPDGSEVWEAWEGEVVKRLNGPQAYARWKAAMG